MPENPAQHLQDLITKVELATSETEQAAAMQTLRAEVDRTIATYVERLAEARANTVAPDQAEQVLTALGKAFPTPPGDGPQLVESYERYEVVWPAGDLGWPREFIDHPDIDNLLPYGVWVDAIDASRLGIYTRS
ncbi:hypothetical protein AB0K18_42555 [Nonomuraea sp. NPDC049421]|uniref:hypothetical protein n=1 Tax=Nonomuraea sp. NPDC049421 TaxID=3155275 RepID=UPI00342E815A